MHNSSCRLPSGTLYKPGKLFLPAEQVVFATRTSCFCHSDKLFLPAGHVIFARLTNWDQLETRVGRRQIASGGLLQQYGIVYQVLFLLVNSEVALRNAKGRMIVDGHQHDAGSAGFPCMITKCFSQGMAAEFFNV